jgi:hypothetical protein
MNSIESKIRTYWLSKYPYLYYVQYITIPIVFALWIFGNLLGIYFLSKQATIGQVFWTAAWFAGGAIIFRLSLWYKLGIQIIKIDEAGICVTKKFAFIRISKRILKNNIHSVSIKKFEAFNPFTGTDLTTNVKLGWLLINDDQNYFLNSYLFPIEDLQEFKKKLIAEKFEIA